MGSGSTHQTWSLEERGWESGDLNIHSLSNTNANKVRREGGGNKSNRKNGGRATEGLNANGPAAKEDGSLEAKSSNGICFGELQSGSMRANPT